mmetsp:Transcript_5656/g.5168  ORF Transcript_5656/g.5168 Transcript_5656/m.5168 type:complete len:85 (-) Transcript_5656:892-1146(-)
MRDKFKKAVRAYFNKFNHKKQAFMQEEIDDNFEDRIDIMNMYTLNNQEKTKKDKDDKLWYLEQKCSNGNMFRFKYFNEQRIEGL